MSKPFPKSSPLIAAALLALAVLLWWVARPKPPPPAPAAAPRVSTTTPSAPAPVAAAVPAPAPPSAPPDDARNALDAALQNPDPRERARLFGELLQRWLQRDPEGALSYVRTLPRSSESSQALLQVLHVLGRRDVDRALLLARDLIRGREELPFYSGLFDRLARENLPGALQKLDAVPAGEAREYAVRALTDVWTRADANAALAWAEQQKDSAVRTAALESVFNEMSMRDPARAVELARKSLKPPALDRTVSRAIQILSSTDPNRAAGLVDLLPPGDLQTMSAVTVAQALANRNLPHALDWVKTLSIDYTRWIALNGVLTIWSQKDSQAAARYVLDMPPGQPLEFAARHLAFLLAANPRDAVMWAEALPSDAARGAAYPMIASSWAQRAPAEAVKWAATLREDWQHADSITAAFSYWMLLDPKAAQTWLEAADLDPKVKASLRAR